MEYVLNENTLDIFAEYGINVWDIDPKADKKEIAHRAIEKTKEYFISLGIPTSLKSIGIGEENLELMAKQAVKYGKIGSMYPLDHKDILNIFKASL